MVRVAVLTYRRPDDLAAILPELSREAEAARSAGWEVDILVVDNDPQASAREIVTAAGVGYVHEPEPGIATARNRALDESAACDLLVFIDDDERPVEGWLNLLLDTYRRYGCAVVGPVISRFDGEPDPWIIDGGFFTRRRMPTGTEVTVAATNNLLLDLTEVRALGLRFDVEFGLSGGSDTVFTRQLVQRGGRMVWCDEAIVYDVVPANRATRDWVLRRSLRSGSCWSASSRHLARTPGERLRWLAADLGSGLARVAGGLVRLAAGFISRDRGLRAAGARNLARGTGLVAGVFGYRYFEYKRTGPTNG